MRVSIERFNPHGIYLIENGINLMLWIGRNSGINGGPLNDIFGKDSPEAIDNTMVCRFVDSSAYCQILTMIYPDRLVP